MDTSDDLQLTNEEYDYCEVIIKSSLYSSFIEYLKNRGPLEYPCYLDLKNKPNVVYMHKSLFEKILEVLDSVYFISKKPDMINTKVLLSCFKKQKEKIPIIGTICTIQIEEGEFLVVNVDLVKNFALIRNTTTYEQMKVPLKYLNL